MNRFEASRCTTRYASVGADVARVSRLIMSAVVSNGLPLDGSVQTPPSRSPATSCYGESPMRNTTCERYSAACAKSIGRIAPSASTASPLVESRLHATVRLRLTEADQVLQEIARALMATYTAYNCPPPSRWTA
jgi:hypothetical protein